MSPKLLDDTVLHAREQTILDAAQQLINQIGTTALTMDKVVAQVPFSKGTVYNHFSSKEDLLIGLCNSSMQDLVAMFQRALSIKSCSRNRMLAVGFAYMLYAYLYPDKFMLVITAKTPSVSEKASPARQNEHLDLDNRLLNLVSQVLQQAMTDHDLTLTHGMSPQEVTFAFWSIGFGTISLLSENVERCGTRNNMLLERAVVTNCNLVLDGLNWQPLSDPDRTAQLINLLKAEVFSTEMALLEQQSRPLKL